MSAWFLDSELSTGKSRLTVVNYEVKISSICIRMYVDSKFD